MFDLISCFNLYLVYIQVHHDVLLDIHETSPPTVDSSYSYIHLKYCGNAKQSGIIKIQYNLKLKELICVNVLLLGVVWVIFKDR